MDPSKADFVSRAAALEHAPSHARRLLVARTALVRFARRKPVWAAGTPATHLYFVRAGVVREAVDDVIVGFRGRGEVAGEVSAIAAAAGARACHHTGGVAHEEVQAYALAVADLAELMGAEARLAVHLAGVVAARRRTVEARFGGLPARTAEARVAVAVLELADAFGVRDSRGVILNLRVTHKELASMVGASRETASVAVAAWRRAGLLQVQDRRLVLLDAARLADVAAGVLTYSGRA